LSQASESLFLPLTLELTRAERALAYLIGNLRWKENRAVGIRDLRVHDATKDIDQQGIAAELAFARAANVYPDLCTDPRAGGVDCVLPSGVTVDIKSTTREKGNLIAPVSKHKNPTHADISVLVKGQFPLTREGKIDYARPARMTIVGWAWTKDLLDPSTIRQLRTPTHFIDRDQLHQVLPLVVAPDGFEKSEMAVDQFCWALGLRVAELDEAR